MTATQSSGNATEVQLWWLRYNNFGLLWTIKVNTEPSTERSNHIEDPKHVSLGTYLYCNRRNIFRCPEAFPSVKSTQGISET